MRPLILPRVADASHPPVAYRCRETGATVLEPSPAGAQQRWAYETATGGTFQAPVFYQPLSARLVAHLMASPRSRKLIPGFVERFGIDTSELDRPLEAYESFEAFFERRLRPEARPFDPDPDRLPAPADGKLRAYPKLGPNASVPVNGRRVPITELLGADAAPYLHGAALVLRLAPYDYHRFHFVSDGVAEPHRPDVVTGGMPRRAMAFQQTERFGRIGYIEVGACEVGRIIQTHTAGPVTRGQEKGHFRRGGSTLVLLFEPQRVVFDADLIEATAVDLETRIRAGAGIGRRVDAR